MITEQEVASVKTIYFTVWQLLEEHDLNQKEYSLGKGFNILEEMMDVVRQFAQPDDKDSPDKEYVTAVLVALSIIRERTHVALKVAT